ncbi:hypothetical protein TNCV_3542761 [Trichonephila clavipes]|nr:hypothetical protein TNCV_3542761 [Trichonephila clavipes]
MKWLNWTAKLVLKLEGVESEGTRKSGMRKEYLAKLWSRVMGCIKLGVDMDELLVVGVGEGILSGSWLAGSRWPFTHCSKTSQMCLIGFKSGLLGGQFLTEKSEECSSVTCVRYRDLAGKLLYRADNRIALTDGGDLPASQHRICQKKIIIISFELAISF